MSVKNAYDDWSSQYDSNENKTRDLEARALRAILDTIEFGSCLEIGCGTGKNTEWLITKANKITAVDLSEKMLEKAKQKIRSDKVQFIQADILKPWKFGNNYDLISFSLVLEHIEDLIPIFEQVSQALTQDGHIYIGELHPFKQYAGSKARYETEKGTEIVECHNHHISDFITAGKKFGLVPVDIKEFFDHDDRSTIPRILTILMKKS